MDAEEIARLRAWNGDNSAVQALCDALEQAQKATENACEACDMWERLAREAEAQRDQAQKDAKDARALLGEANVAIEFYIKQSNQAFPYDYTGLRARIEALLTPPQPQSAS